MTVQNSLAHDLASPSSRVRFSSTNLCQNILLEICCLDLSSEDSLFIEVYQTFGGAVLMESVLSVNYLLNLMYSRLNIKTRILHERCCWVTTTVNLLLFIGGRKIYSKMIPLHPLNFFDIVFFPFHELKDAWVLTNLSEIVGPWIMDPTEQKSNSTRLAPVRFGDVEITGFESPPKQKLP